MADLPPNPYRRQALTAAAGTWIIFIWFIFFVDPAFVANVGWKMSYLPFILLLSVSLGLTIWGLTGRWKRSGLWTLIVTVSLWLRMNQLDSIVNMFLLIAFGVVWEYYWNLSKTHNLIN